MPPLARRTLAAMTALSLLLCVATAGLWVRSYRRADFACYQRRLGASPYLLTWQGMIQIKLVTCSHERRTGWEHFSGDEWGIIIDYGRGVHRWEDPTSPSARGTQHRCGPFVYGAGTFYNAGVQTSPPHSYTFHFLTFPAWSLCSLLAILPACRVWRLYHRRARLNVGRCRRCSYDLTANVSGICPECGTKTI